MLDMGSIKKFFRTESVTVTPCAQSKNPLTGAVVSKRTDTSRQIKVSIQPQGGKLAGEEYGENSGDMVILFADSDAGVQRGDIVTVKEQDYKVTAIKAAVNYLRIDAECLK